MFKFRYSLYSPIRLLLPIAVIFLLLPWIFQAALMNYYAFPIFYFFGSYFFFLNFPSISETLHSRPIYVEDLSVINGSADDDHTFKKLYAVIMNFILAVLISIFAEYVIVQGISNKPMVEIIGLIGGNVKFYSTAQNIMGKFLLRLCYNIKEESHRRTSSFNKEFEMQEMQDNINNTYLNSDNINI